MAALLTRETLSNPYVFSTLSLKKLSGLYVLEEQAHELAIT